jgi:hypothetical protein
MVWATAKDLGFEEIEDVRGAARCMCLCRNSNADFTATCSGIAIRTYAWTVVLRRGVERRWEAI